MTAPETPDQAATRRRWITLAEVVAVAGVVIAGLSLYTTWSDRRADETARVAERSQAAREQARVELVGTVRDGGKALALTDARHDLSEASVTFPKALGVGPQHPAGDPVIEAGWFAERLLELTDGGSDEKTGRLPVLVTVRYFAGDEARTASGIYDVVWRTQGHMLRGRSLAVEGLKLRQHGGSQAALDAAWARLKP